MSRNYEQEIIDRQAWIKEILVAAKAPGVVLGLSGGKDSAVVAALCIGAGIPVIGVNLSIDSNPADRDYVEALRANLLDRYPETRLTVCYLNLKNPFTALTSFLPDVFESLEKDPRIIPGSTPVHGNIKARLRMTTLYAIANRYNYLVAGTGNASEAYVGYFTKWGDGAHDFNPIGDLKVEEVIALGKALNLGSIVDRTPSAGLWEGQTDEGELGVTYAQIGQFIDHAKNGVLNESGDKSPEALIIQRKHQAAQHKLNPIPVYRRSN